MSKVPKWVGDTIEIVFRNQIHPVEVSAVEYLSDKLKKVVFKGNLGENPFTPGQVVKFRISDTEYRHYTPVKYDINQGICEVLFYLHGKGIGSIWAENLKIGDFSKILGPGGFLKYKEESKYHFLWGDETSLGLFKCLKESILQNQQEYLCLLELEKEHHNWVSLSGLTADVIDKSEEDLQTYLNDFNEKCWKNWQNATFYLSGRAGSIQSFRKMLRKKGVKSQNIQTEPYWANGKHGL
ncbi:NADPH-dependent ferric siderophore reductase, contains FAD-binding and SIP domains [Pseudarcicella hirudinis]|uniref:NADPH-dependent ferric siderophore reductase, contains FAD-binding and SIP domains n=1 Tax=Pseudarcicella hirudinis TaxID=1079859 RepID=A0A1I5TFG7_9BACT|nr:siderophore-interacting protein [Pseudarcicella hirudinis]SFP81812.1 NADPH-dependent ferric siderophore reductase, contains FAD-binding and SIP domains [Pseudarcicella hirudinis]